MGLPGHVQRRDICLTKNALMSSSQLIMSPVERTICHYIYISQQYNQYIYIYIFMNDIPKIPQFSHKTVIGLNIHSMSHMEVSENGGMPSHHSIPI